ncbi:MAG: hypothetical protein DRI46_10025 [Chloroflexi bacterium]|nr:MAG: hypothetical protein DRI46_10025 [Chloroflexota bacterium]
MEDDEKQQTEVLVELARQRVILERMQRDLRELKKESREQYVTKAQFEPIQNLVYGMVGLVLVAVITALLAIVVKVQVP